MDLINTLLDIEKDFRECDGLLSNGLRYLNCVRDSGYFDLMEEFGFIVGNKFISIHSIFNIVEGMSETNRVFALESVACDLSLIYELTRG